MLRLRGASGPSTSYGQSKLKRGLFLLLLFELIDYLYDTGGSYSIGQMTTLYNSSKYILSRVQKADF